MKISAHLAVVLIIAVAVAEYLILIPHLVDEDLSVGNKQFYTQWATGTPNKFISNGIVLDYNFSSMGHTTSEEAKIIYKNCIYLGSSDSTINTSSDGRYTRLNKWNFIIHFFKRK